jgi:hypothetical protein
MARSRACCLLSTAAPDRRRRSPPRAGDPSGWRTCPTGESSSVTHTEGCSPSTPPAATSRPCSRRSTVTGCSSRTTPPWRPTARSGSRTPAGSGRSRSGRTTSSSTLNRPAPAALARRRGHDGAGPAVLCERGRPDRRDGCRPRRRDGDPHYPPGRPGCGRLTPKRTARVLALDSDGRTVHDLAFDATHWHLATGVREHDGGSGSAASSNRRSRGQTRSWTTRDQPSCTSRLTSTQSARAHEGNHVSPSGSASTSAMTSRWAKGRASS